MLHCDSGDHDLPDAGGGMCCMGAAVRGPMGCTCWTPTYDQEQKPVPVAGLVSVEDLPKRSTMCADCAFRPDSPERRGDPGVAHSGEGELDDLAVRSQPFACHQGMRRILRRTHPSGAVVESHPGHYDPRIIGGVAYLADGSPAPVCAGWRAARAAALRGGSS